MNLRLPPIFSDGMVLQRNTGIKIWGTVAPNENVEVNFLGKVYSAKADENGKWLCTADEQQAGGPYQMTVTSGAEKITFDDILVGDVWLCGGQSNMELMMNRVASMYPDEIQAENLNIRQFKVPQVYNFHSPCDETAGGQWESYSPKNALNFTAAGYFFAKKLYERYKVPIGLLASAVGGTPICAWMSKEMLAAFPDELAEAEKCADDEYVKNTIKDYDEYSKNYFDGLGAGDEGFKNGWFKEKFDDTDWEEIPLCNPINTQGAVWFRKKINIPPEMYGKQAVMFLGTVVDSDLVYVNGEEIGSIAYRYPPSEFSFTVPTGPLAVAIRAVNYSGGQGGFTIDKNRFITCGNKSIDLEGNWKRRTGAVYESLKPQVFFNYKPSGLYNGMISPLTNFGIKGAIWYQGESDTGNHTRYAEKFTALVDGWRKQRGYDFPFLFVQLAYYAYTGNTDWNLLREQQKRCLSIKNTGMACALDIGEYNDLHPQNKRDVGERLARLAMRLAYNETLPPSPFEMCNY